MQLRSTEKVIRVFRHHPTPFAGTLIKVIFASFPFFLIAFFIVKDLTSYQTLIVNLSIISFFLIIITHSALIYWLDRLVVTNQRVVYVNWVTLFRRDESEAELNDIQEIYTKEKGIFSAFYVFDYGIFRLETASTHTTILFEQAPDPEGIKQFIYTIKNPHYRNPLASNLTGAEVNAVHQEINNILPVHNKTPHPPTNATASSNTNNTQQ